MRAYQPSPAVSTPGTARRARNASRSRPAYGVRTASRMVTVPGRGVRAAAASAQLGRRERVDLADRVVELADAREAGRERDLRELEVGRLDEHACRLRATGAGQGQRAGAELGGEQPAQVARRVADPRRQRIDSLAVDDAVGDQPHRAAGDVGGDVPLGAARGGVGQAALAGPEPGRLGRGRRRVELDVAQPPASGPGTRGGSRCRSCGPRCRRRRRSAGRASSPRGSRPRASSLRVAVVMAPSCTPPPTVSRGNRTPAGAGRRRRRPSSRPDGHTRPMTHGDDRSVG